MHPVIRQRWPEVRALFEAALKLPRAQRATFLADHAVDAEVAAAAAMLLAEESHTLDDLPQSSVPEAALSQPIRLGHYQLLRVLGRGGMGVVWLAQQDQPRRLVAIKMIAGLSDAGALARFHREAELLARLSHPGIAQVIELDRDADAQPFLVMEYVDGEPLDLVMARQPRRDMLRLMARIADAVEHAHARGIVHRDLKPGNILVTRDSQPKILDFGIAVLTGGASAALTATGALLGTPAYMSPEQAAGQSDVDCRADVYALGAILYEQLCGHLPVPVAGLTPLQALRQVNEHTPLPLGQVDPQLRGELETIAETALQKDPRLRYASAGAFADDLRRLLSDLPIRARRVGALRRSWLFARRNPALTGALLVAILGLVAGALLAMAQAHRAALEARRAQDAAATSAAVSQTLVALLGAGHPDENGGAPATVIDLLRRGGADALRPLEDQPVVRRAVLAEIGGLHHVLGDNARVVELLVPELTHTPQSDDAVGWRMAVTLAGAAAQLPDLPLAAQWFAQLDAALGQRPVTDGLRQQFELAYADFLRDQGKADQALVRIRAWTALLRRSASPPGVLSEAAQTEAEILLFQGEHAQALQVLGNLPQLPPSAVTALQQARIDSLLARAEIELDRPREAEARLRSSLAWHARVLGEDHGQTLRVREELGNVLGEQSGRQVEAREIIADVLARRERIFGEKHPVVAVSHNQLAVIAYGLGQHAEAAQHFEAAVQIWRRVLAPEHDHILTAESNLAAAWGELGEVARALPVLDRVVDLRRRQGSTALAPLLLTRGLALEKAGQQQLADDDFRISMALEQARPGALPSAWTWAMALRGRSLRRLGALDQAQPLLEASLRNWSAGPYGCGLRCAQTQLELAQLLQQRRRPKGEVRALADAAFATRRERLGENHPLTVEAQAFLANLTQSAKPPQARR